MQYICPIFGLKNKPSTGAEGKWMRHLLHWFVVLVLPILQDLKKKQMFLVGILWKRRAGGHFCCYFRLLYYFQLNSFFTHYCSYPQGQVGVLRFKKLLYLEFRATLNFRKFKVALNSMYRIFSNFAKSCISSCLSKFYNNKKNSACRFWNISA